MGKKIFAAALFSSFNAIYLTKIGIWALFKKVFLRGV